jgi:hypothetical protein
MMLMIDFKASQTLSAPIRAYNKKKSKVQYDFVVEKDGTLES